MFSSPFLCVRTRADSLTSASENACAPWNEKILTSPAKIGAFAFATVSARQAVTAGSVTRTPQERARGARVVSSRPSGGRAGRRAGAHGRGGLTRTEIEPDGNITNSETDV
jgi:hypothetical protein